MFLKIS